MKAILVISERDNVATALESLEQGRRIADGHNEVVVQAPIPRGHKVALRSIRTGDPVIKYGSPIGTAITDIEPGALVHTHNVASARGRGDLARPDAEPDEPRLAEPPDPGTP